jgi:hypothetical protein
MTGGTKFSKRELKKEIERDLAAKARETLARLKEKIAAARERRRTTTSRAVQRCRTARQSVRERQKAERARVRERLNAEFAEERQRLRQRCEARKAKIRALARRAEDGALREWDEERRYQRQLHRAESAHKRKTAAAERRSAKERRAESDDAVRANIPAELVRVFERVKRSIRGTPHMSRTEAFLHWIEENPDEVLAIQEADAEKRFRKLLAEQARLERARARKLRGAVRRAETALQAVPF